MPTPDEVRTLELNPGVPVVADDLYAADRHEFAFEWTEPDGVG